MTTVQESQSCSSSSSSSSSNPKQKVTAKKHKAPHAQDTRAIIELSEQSLNSIYKLGALGRGAVGNGPAGLAFLETLNHTIKNFAQIHQKLKKSSQVWRSINK